MGATFSCPFASLDDLDSQFESFLVRSISFGGSDDPVEPSTFKSLSSTKMILEGSLSFNGREVGANISVQGPTDENVSDQLAAADDGCERSVENLFPEFGNQRHAAALKLQKTYKSFRTRRQLADCAVLVEQRWWKLLDFAELKHSSISFFDIERPETALSRWSRARTKAAKVGKGLSKDEKARKLALQHWLEAIDPRHRYGHNLQFYYVSWLHCDSKQPFFYWLDIGEGKEVNLERCPRSKLQQQCIKYLGPTERKAYEVVVKDGKFIYEQSGHLLDTKGGPNDVKWIFVLSVSKTLYVGQKIKGTFQHSSFLAGSATLSAGRLEVEQGTLKAVWPHSGHYLPTEENFEEFMSFLKQHNVDLSVVQRAPNGDDEVSFGPCKSLSASDISEANSFKAAPAQETDSSKKETTDAEITNPSLQRWSRKLSSIQIPKRKDIDELFKNSIESPDGYETAIEYLSDSEFSVSKDNLFDEDREDPIPEEKIIKRINSHKGLKSYQLAKQLSCKWTTGAGPRIGCVRDYPLELQVRALEEVHLSPRSTTSFPHKTAAEGIASPLCRERSLFASESPKLTLMVTDNKN